MTLLEQQKNESEHSKAVADAVADNISFCITLYGKRIFIALHNLPGNFPSEGN